ncbi:histidine phosphatase superfamily [Thamnidium elegans]|nr:histidine phosphatase superfamily [Thamnidium elegans]
MVSTVIPTAFIVRHGERLDHTDKSWQPDPSLGIWDPPVTTLGLQQSEKTGIQIIEMMRAQKLDIRNTKIVVYSSPFQRCIDTSIGIIKGIQNTVKTTPTLRLDIGLGEWMCERFFEYVCPAQYLVSRQYEKLARKQAYSYSMLAKNNTQTDGDVLPTLNIDYAYSNSNQTEFDFPERYTDMIHRFEETRLHCLENANSLKKADESVVVIFVTHAVGANALLDGFRNKVTIPLESNYCSISCVRRSNPLVNMSDLSDQSDEDSEEYRTGFNFPSKSTWYIETAMYNRHL